MDDEDGILLLLTRILEPAGYTVQTASDAHAALRHIAEGPPAVALCDIHMPGPSGLWLAEQIRHASPATAVVLATSDANVPPAESLREGVVAYVLKPFEPAEVLQAVAEAYTWWSARSGQPVPTLQPRRRRTTAAAAAVPTAWPAPPARTGRTGRRVVSPRTWLIVLIGVILAAAAAWYWWRGNPDRQLSRIAAASGMVLVFDGQGGKVAQGSKAERHTQGATLVADVRFIPDGQTAMVSVPDSSGTVRRLEYLADGRLAAEQTLVRGRMVASSRWVYAEGAWPRVSNGSTAQAREELDALGNPLVRILTDGTRLQYTHVVDAHGNWVSRKIIRVDPQGGQSPAVSQSRHIEYWD